MTIRVCLLCDRRGMENLVPRKQGHSLMYMTRFHLQDASKSNLCRLLLVDQQRVESFTKFYRFVGCPGSPAVPMFHRNTADKNTRF